MILLSILAPLLAQAAAAQSAGTAQPSPLAPSEIVAAAPAPDWVAIPASDLLVMTLAPDRTKRVRRGRRFVVQPRPRLIVIQLIPAPFSQGWVRNIRKLAAAHWYDGVSVNRVQDNYVAQWGDATEKKALPAGLETMPESVYDQLWSSLPGLNASRHAPAGGRSFDNGNCSMVEVNRKPCEGWTHPADVYADGIFFWQGWPLASQAKPSDEDRRSWPVHCYGMVGVGRDLSPNTGNGAELYTVIGHAPRHLDRNIALVGRVIEGIEHLSSLPRGTEALGFYKTPEERTPVVSIRLATELPAAEQPRFEYLSTESATFARYADARANRKDAFFIRPAGGADVCNVPVPVRRSPTPVRPE